MERTLAGGEHQLTVPTEVASISSRSLEEFLTSYSRFFLSTLRRSVRIDNVAANEATEHCVSLVLSSTRQSRAQDVAVVFGHECRYSGCLMEDCQLCKNNPHKLCSESHILDQQYWVRDDGKGGQPVNSKCGAKVYVQLREKHNQQPVFYPDVVVKVYVVDGELPGSRQMRPDGHPNPLYFSDEGSPLFTCGSNGDVIDKDGGITLQLARDDEVIAKAEIPEIQFLNKNSKFKNNGKTYKTFKMMAVATQKFNGENRILGFAESSSFKVTTKKGFDGCRKAEYLFATAPITDKTFQSLGETTINNLKTQYHHLETVEDLTRLVDRAKSDNNVELQLREVLNMSKDDSKWLNLCKFLGDKVVYDDNVPRIWVSSADSGRIGLIYKCQRGQVQFHTVLGAVLNFGDVPLRVAKLNEKLQHECNVELETLRQQAMSSWYRPRHPGWHKSTEAAITQEISSMEFRTIFKEVITQAMVPGWLPGGGASWPPPETHSGSLTHSGGAGGYPSPSVASDFPPHRRSSTSIKHEVIDSPLVVQQSTISPRVVISGLPGLPHMSQQDLQDLQDAHALSPRLSPHGALVSHGSGGLSLGGQQSGSDHLAMLPPSSSLMHHSSQAMHGRVRGVNWGTVQHLGSDPLAGAMLQAPPASLPQACARSPDRSHRRTLSDPSALQLLQNATSLQQTMNAAAATLSSLPSFSISQPAALAGDPYGEPGPSDGHGQYSAMRGDARLQMPSFLDASLREGFTLLPLRTGRQDIPICRPGSRAMSSPGEGRLDAGGGMEAPAPAAGAGSGRAGGGQQLYVRADSTSIYVDEDAVHAVDRGETGPKAVPAGGATSSVMDQLVQEEISRAYPSFDTNLPATLRSFSSVSYDWIPDHFAEGTPEAGGTKRERSFTTSVHQLRNHLEAGLANGRENRNLGHLDSSGRHYPVPRQGSRQREVVAGAPSTAWATALPEGGVVEDFHIQPLGNQITTGQVLPQQSSALSSPTMASLQQLRLSPSATGGVYLEHLHGVAQERSYSAPPVIPSDSTGAVRIDAAGSCMNFAAAYDAFYAGGEMYGPGIMGACDSTTPGLLLSADSCELFTELQALAN